MDLGRTLETLTVEPVDTAEAPRESAPAKPVERVPASR